MTTLAQLSGSEWLGTCELWLDPLGDEATTGACSLVVEGDAISYTWTHGGAEQRGSLICSEIGATFSDTFHSPDPMSCRRLDGAPGLIVVEGRYGEPAEWRWRIGVAVRPTTGQLVLQMTNVAPWGEEARAVRMTLKRRLGVLSRVAEPKHVKTT